MLKLPKHLHAETLPEKDSSIRFKSTDDSDPEQKIRFIDSFTGHVWGFLVIDDTRRGPAIGGIRIAQDLSLDEMSRLAYSMTLKTSAACLSFGGGKAGLIANPILLRREPQLRSDLMALFAEALFPFDNYIAAPDMGTDEHDVQQIYEYNSKLLGKTSHTRGGVGREAHWGGIPIDEWGLTAHGLIAAITTLEAFESKIKINDAHVVVQGYGNVGASTASKLVAEGAIIVGASDINAGLWEPTGLDIVQLNAIRNTVGGLSNYNGKVEKHFNSNQVDWLLEAPCDILVPAARPNAITARNADRVQCKVILQGANTPVNKMTEYYLSNRRGIISLSDFIVNSGGVIGCAVELAIMADADFKKKVESEGVRLYTEKLIKEIISKNVIQVLSQIIAKGGTDTFFREEGMELTQKRLRNPGNTWL